MALRGFVKIAIMAALLVMICGSVHAGNIDATNKYAWSENTGWLNFKPTGGGVTVYSDHLEGYAWNEGIGWISLGAYIGGGAHTYANSSNTTYGVNKDDSGNLSGYAWSENFGWINFKPTGGGVTIDTSGNFGGYAWGEGIGWIHFANTDPAYRIIVSESDTGNIIAGHVYTIDNKPLSDIEVAASSDGFASEYRVKTDVNGYYALQVPEISDIGKGYVVEVHSSDYVYQAYDRVSSRESAKKVVAGTNNIDFYLISGLSISGSVKDKNGNPLSGVHLTASSYEYPGFRHGTAVTDSTGKYTILGLLPAYDYIVKAVAPGYPTQYYNQDLQLLLYEYYAQTISLITEADNPSNIDFILDKGYVIRGTVYIGDAPAPAGMRVNLYAYFGSDDSVQTDAQGRYEFVGLSESGYYILSINGWGYIPAYYNSAGTVFDSDDAEGLGATLASDAADRNIVLMVGSKIQGKIVNSIGQPISGVQVEALWLNLNETITTQTDASGSYAIPGIWTGDYEISLSHDDYRYQSKDINIPSMNQTVTADFVMTAIPTSSISGTITGLPLGKTAAIGAWSSIKDSKQTVFVDGTGGAVSYTITGLRPSFDYIVELSADGYPNQFIGVDNSETSASGIDFVMPAAVVSVFGKVVFPDDAIPGDTAQIDVFSDFTGITANTDVKFTTSRNVFYQITGLASAPDYIVYINSDKYISHYYNGTDKGTLYEYDAIVFDAAKTPSITADFVLSSGKSISGKVIGGRSGFIVTAWSESTGVHSEAVLAADGTYFVKGLDSASDYTVGVFDPFNGDFFYNKRETVKNRFYATPVSTMEKNASGIDITISPAESIIGKVTNADGQPLAKIWVEAWSEFQESGNGVFTDARGYFQIAGLSKGSDYTVSARKDWYSDPIEQHNIATGVSNLDFRLTDSGYRIKGFVKDEKGFAVPKVTIEVWSESLKLCGSIWAVTGNKGYYEITGLSKADDYVLLIKPESSSSYAFSTIDKISLPDDSLNITLEAGTEILGKITEKDTGNAIDKVQVTAVSSDNKYFQQKVETDENGAYAITNVPITSASYDISALKKGYIGQTKTAVSHHADFVLEKSGSITGQIRDQRTGKILSGVMVEAYSLSMAKEKYFSGSGISDNDGKYIINELAFKTSSGIVLNDYVVTVKAPAYPPQSKDGKKVGDAVDFNLSRGKENEISGTIAEYDGNPASGVTYVAEAFEQNGDFVSSATADNTGFFNIGTLLPGKQYYLKFTAFSGRQQTASQWSAPGSSSSYDTGIDESASGNVPAEAKLYSTNTIMRFRFGKQARSSVYRDYSVPGTVQNITSPSHVTGKITNSKSRDSVASANTDSPPVSNNPNITVAWTPPSSGTGQQYYVVYNTDQNYTIDKRNAPESMPGSLSQTTSQTMSGDNIAVYCHIAVVDSRGRIGETVSVPFRIDTVPPTNVAVIAPSNTSGSTINLTLGASGANVKEMYISNSDYGKNGQWETRVMNKEWTLSQGDGTKNIYVQVRDEAGNISNYQVSTQKTSPTPPAKPVTPDTPSGGGSSSSTVTVIQNQTFILNITAPDGTLIGKIIVQGLSGNITFVILSGNIGNVFEVDSNTGEIRIKSSKVLQQNGSMTYIMPVQVSDGITTASAYITLKVAIPEKDKITVADQSFSISSKSEDGTYVGRVDAIAADTSAILSYHIVSGNEDDIFAINTKTGDIIVWDSRKLSESTADFYVLKVEVSDGKNTATADITIKVTDSGSTVLISDQKFGVNEDAAVGTVIGKVNADSTDTSAILSYRIISGGEGMFSIDEKTGEIRLIGQSDYDKASSYTLEVEVSDGTSTASAAIRISVNAVSKEILKGTWTWEKPDITGSSSAWFKNIAGIFQSEMIIVGGRFDYDASEYKNLIWRYSDRQWFEMQTNSSEWLYDIWGRSGSDIFAVGWEGIILHYDGAFWTGMSSPKDENLKAVHGDGSSVIAVGEKGTMLVYDGSVWTSVDTESSAALNGIWGKDGVFFISAEGGIILRYDGRSITAENTGISENLYDIGGRSLSDIYAVGDKGTILHYDGKAWITQRTGGTGKFSSISVSENHIFIAGENGVIFHSSGRGWAQVPTGTQVNFRGIRTDGRSAFAVGDNGAILRFDIE